MQISVFDLFKIGIGPSSSHTVGPMKAARLFARQIETDDKTATVVRVKAELFGSLGATGRGHGSPKAVMLGLEGETPEGIAVDSIAARVAAIRETESLNLLGRKRVAFVERRDLILHKRKSLPKHPNGMIFTAFAADGEIVSQAAYYSIGGGFVVGEEGETEPAPDAPCPFPFASAAELLARCDESGLPMSGVMLANESARAPKADIRAGLLKIWAVMQECVDNGCARDGELPGGLKVKRRAAALHRQLRGEKQSGGGYGDPLQVMDWVNLFALAVNEENAGGGRVVTAPTNGAAGIAPAVLHYYRRFVPGADDDGVARFFAHGGGDWRALQTKRVDQRRRSRLPRRSRIGLLDGGGRLGRGLGRHAAASRKRGRNRDGAQSRLDLRSDRRLGADSVHRAQRRGLGQGD